MAGKMLSAATAVSPSGCHIKAGSKLWEAKLGAMGSCTSALGRMPRVGSLASGAGRLQVARLPVRAVRAVASENEGQPNQGIANTGAGLERQTERKKALKVTTGPTVGDEACSDSRVKSCSVCKYSKVLEDFEEMVATEDKRHEMCRACLATLRATFRQEELFHLRLTPEEAWERAKTCKTCFRKKEVRGMQLRRLQLGRPSDPFTNTCALEIRNNMPVSGDLCLYQKRIISLFETILSFTNAFCISLSEGLLCPFVWPSLATLLMLKSCPGKHDG
jgi:hypothetical protein